MVVNCKECGQEIDQNSIKCIHCGADQRIFFRQHKILTGMIIIAILGFIWVALSGGKSNPITPPAANPNSASANSSDQQNPESIKVTAEELVAAYRASELNANRAYKGKAAEIAGTVAGSGVSSGRTYIIISSSTNFSHTNVQCFFNDSVEIGKVSNLKKGDSVVVHGFIEGKTLNIQVNNCILE